jgi:hypothetical protein
VLGNHYALAEYLGFHRQGAGHSREKNDARPGHSLDGLMLAAGTFDGSAVVSND